jgi:hypothetical protein
MMWAARRKLISPRKAKKKVRSGYGDQGDERPSSPKPGIEQVGD